MRSLLPLALALLLGSGCAAGASKPKTVSRLDVADAAGRPAVVLSTSGAFPPAVVAGKEYARSTAVQGVVLYDPEGNEAGGFGSGLTRNGATVKLLALDYQNAEAMGLRVVESSQGSSATLLILEPPPSPDMDPAAASKAQHPRAALSRERDGSVGLSLYDKEGKERIGLVVAADGTPTLVVDGQAVDLRRLLALAAPNP